MRENMKLKSQYQSGMNSAFKRLEFSLQTIRIQRSFTPQSTIEYLSSYR